MTRQPAVLANPLARALPALAALVYPAAIWAGPAISPLFLLVALAVPAAGVAGVSIGLLRPIHARVPLRSWPWRVFSRLFDCLHEGISWRRAT